MKTLGMMLVIFVLAMQTAMAGTLTVRADGTGNYTSIAAAINAAQTGDQVIIDDSAVYAEAGQAAPTAGVTGVTVKAAAGKTPTWDFSAHASDVPAIYLLNGSGWTFDGIKFFYNGTQGNSPWNCALIILGNAPTIKNCTFMGKMATAIYYGGAGAASAGVDISYCSFLMRDDNASITQDCYAIFWGDWVTGTVEIDHCTIGCTGVSGGGNRILLWDNAMHNTVAVSNTIFFGNELGYWCADFAGTSAMSFEYVVSSASAHNPGWLGATTNLGHNQAPVADSMVNDPVNGDFSLKAGSPALNAAKDGKHIGSWQTPVPVELSAFSAE